VRLGNGITRIKSVFKEDRQGAANFAVFRKMALSLLKQHPRKDSIARKRKRAALDTAFLGEILAGATKLEKI
jgi:hypothetical protein